MQVQILLDHPSQTQEEQFKNNQAPPTHLSMGASDRRTDLAVPERANLTKEFN